MGVFAADADATRSALNPSWTALCPEPDSRPVRHTVTSQLPAGFRVELDQAALDGITVQQRAGLLFRVAQAGVAGNGDVLRYRSGSLSG